GATLIPRNLDATTGKDIRKIDAEQQFRSEIDDDEEEDGREAEAAPSSHRNDDATATAREAKAASAEATAALILNSVAGIFLVEPQLKSTKRSIASALTNGSVLISSRCEL